MPDLLVNLLVLPQLAPELDRLSTTAITIRRAQPFELTQLRNFIKENFSTGWADEVSVGFSNKPVTVYIATREAAIVGFAAYECTRRAFFGPTGVAPDMQGKGVGKTLLIACLWGLREMGYVYGIIGGVGPVEFYKKVVGAIVIPGSDPGIYIDLLN